MRTLVGSPQSFDVTLSQNDDSKKDSADDVRAARVSPNGQFIAIVSRCAVSLWSMTPTVRLASCVFTNERVHGRVEFDGIEWRNDSAAIVAWMAGEPELRIFEVESRYPGRELYALQMFKNNEELDHFSGPGELDGISSIILKYRQTVKVSGRIASLAVLRQNIFVSLDDGRFQTISWSGDTMPPSTQSADKLSFIASHRPPSFDPSHTIHIAQLIYDRLLGVFGWITSEGRAFLTFRSHDPWILLTAQTSDPSTPTPTSSNNNILPTKNNSKKENTDSNINSSNDPSPTLDDQPLEWRGFLLECPHRPSQIAMSLALNPVHRLIAVGYDDGSMAVFTIPSSHPKTPRLSFHLTLQHNLKKGMKTTSSNTTSNTISSTSSSILSQPIKLAWSPDGSTLAVAFSTGGIALWSSTGHPLLSNTSHRHTHSLWSTVGQSLFWSRHQDRLCLISSRRLLFFSCIQSMNPSMALDSSSSLLYWWTATRLFLPLPAQHSLADRDLLRWHTLHLPNGYLNAQSPCRLITAAAASCSSNHKIPTECAALLCAGTRGCCVYNAQREQWQLFESDALEESFRVDHAVFLNGRLLIAAVEELSTARCQLRLCLLPNMDNSIDTQSFSSREAAAHAGLSAMVTTLNSDMMLSTITLDINVRIQALTMIKKKGTNTENDKTSMWTVWMVTNDGVLMEYLVTRQEKLESTAAIVEQRRISLPLSLQRMTAMRSLPWQTEKKDTIEEHSVLLFLTADQSLWLWLPTSIETVNQENSILSTPLLWMEGGVEGVWCMTAAGKPTVTSTPALFSHSVTDMLWPSLWVWRPPYLYCYLSLKEIQNVLPVEWRESQGSDGETSLLYALQGDHSLSSRCHDNGNTEKEAFEDRLMLLLERPSMTMRFSDWSPINISLEDGAMMGVTSQPRWETEQMNGDAQSSFIKPDMRHAYIIPALLKFALQNKMDAFAESLVDSYGKKGHFGLCMEILIHSLLMEIEQTDVSMTKEKEILESDNKTPLAPPTANGLLTALLSLLRVRYAPFPALLARAARQHEIQYWPVLFGKEHSPTELFHRCLREKRFAEACWLVPVMIELEHANVTTDVMLSLLDCLLQESLISLCEDVMRFVKAIQSEENSEQEISVMRIAGGDKELLTKMNSLLMEWAEKWLKNYSLGTFSSALMQRPFYPMKVSEWLLKKRQDCPWIRDYEEAFLSIHVDWSWGFPNVVSIKDALPSLELASIEAEEEDEEKERGEGDSESVAMRTISLQNMGEYMELMKMYEYAVLLYAMVQNAAGMIRVIVSAQNDDVFSVKVPHFAVAIHDLFTFRSPCDVYRMMYTQYVRPHIVLRPT